MTQFQLTTLSVKYLTPSILHVELTRDLNFINKAMFTEIKHLFSSLNSLSDLRVVILTGSGKLFTAGLDLPDALEIFGGDQELDQARKSIRLYDLIKDWQESFLNVLQLRVPVIVGVHSHCIGIGLDLISATDIRFCTEDAKFSIKEIDVGFAADIGTFPRLPLIMGNESFVREMAFTGRTINAEEALKFGLVSKVFKNKEEMMDGLVKIAEEIAAKSPVAVYAVKKVMNKGKFAKMGEVLEDIAVMNMTMLFTKDLGEAVMAHLTKGKAKFSKL